MKKHYHLTSLCATLFIFILIFPSLQAAPYSSLKPSNDTEWPDGRFHGTWQETTTHQGTLQGTLSIGRTSQTGSFTGEIHTLETHSLGLFNGFFFKSTLIGTITKTNNQKLPIVGKISNITENTLQGTLFIPGSNQMTINLIYDYSFLPPPTGPYHIAVQDRHLIDSSRPEYFTEDPGDFREMMIRIWYPVRPGTQTNPVEYMDYHTFQWLKDRSPIPLITIPDNAYLSVNPHLYKNGMIPQVETGFPVLIFSPGYDGNYEIYTSFIEDVVSHGFIVISINHPYISGLTVFPDGRMIHSAPVTNDSFPSIVGDALFVLDYIEQLHQSDPLFQQQLDLDRIGMYGHSFGGACTLECMKRDLRIKAGLTLDGAIGSSIIPQSFDRPLFMMLAEQSFAKNTSNHLFNVTGDDVYLLFINGSTHYAFTDVGLLMSHFIPLIPPHLLLFGTIDAKRMVNITRNFISSFFQVYLNNEPRDVFDELVTMFPETILKSKQELTLN